MSGIYTIPSQNALQSTLDAELSAGGTSMTLADDWSSYFTGVSATNPAILVIDRQDANGTDTPSKREYVEVTNVSGATFTIGTRGKNGSTDQVHSVGARVECVTDVETLRSVKSTYETEHNADGTHDVSGMITGGSVLDEDDMASDSATAIPTQQSVKAYADTKAPTANPTFTGTVSVAGAISQSGTADHITLTPGSSKLVKVAVLRQDNTTNSYVNNSIVLTGWGWMLGNSGVAMNEAVTFGVTFSSAPIVLTGGCGQRNASDPSAIGDLNAQPGYIMVEGYSITTTGFSLGMSRATTGGGTGQTFVNTYRYGYTWIAIGQLN
jgi:hypothetical protein